MSGETIQAVICSGYDDSVKVRSFTCSEKGMVILLKKLKKMYSFIR